MEHYEFKERYLWDGSWICGICKDFEAYTATSPAFSNHLWSKHGLNPEQYYESIVGSAPVCKLEGCSLKTKFKKMSHGYEDFCCKEHKKVWMLERQRSDEGRKAASKKTHEQWENDDGSLLKAVSDAAALSWAEKFTPEERKRMSNNSSKQAVKNWESPEYRERILKALSHNQKLQWDNPDSVFHSEGFKKIQCLSGGKALRTINMSNFDKPTSIVYVIKLSDRVIKIGSCYDLKCRGVLKFEILYQFEYHGNRALIVEHEVLSKTEEYLYYEDDRYDMVGNFDGLSEIRHIKYVDEVIKMLKRCEYE